MKSKRLSRLRTALGLSVGVPATTAAVFGAAFQYLPEIVFAEPISKYSLSGALALAAGSLVALFAIYHAQDREDASPEGVPLQDTRHMLAVARQMTSDNRYGWPHYFPPYADGPQVISSLSSAFGLRIGILLGLDVKGVDWGAVCESLKRDAAEDGGWSAQSQGNESRPEVTASVAGAIAIYSPQDPSVARAKQYLEDLVATGSDVPLRNNTYVVATLLQEARRVGLSPDCVEILASRLVAGARSEDGCKAWTEYLTENAAGEVSTAMTAHAILALQEVRVGGYVLSPVAASTMQSGVSWLRDHAGLDNENTQIIRYPTPGRQEVNAPRHFNAALVAIALLRAGDVSSKGLRGAVRRVEKAFDSGVWRWDAHLLPVWMTFYGLTALIGWQQKQLERRDSKA